MWTSPYPSQRHIPAWPRHIWEHSPPPPPPPRVYVADHKRTVSLQFLQCMLIDWRVKIIKSCEKACLTLTDKVNVFCRNEYKCERVDFEWTAITATKNLTSCLEHKSKLNFRAKIIIIIIKKKYRNVVATFATWLTCQTVQSSMGHYLFLSVDDRHAKTDKK